MCSLLVFFLTPVGLGKILRNSQNIETYYMLNHQIKFIYFYTREYVIQLVLKAMKSPFIRAVEEDSEEKVSSVKPRYNEEPRDWQNMF